MTRVKIKCELCGQEISNSNYTKHLRRHENHPETFETPKYKVYHEGLECQFCGKECKNDNSLRNHERLCKENPNRQLLRINDFNNFGRVAWNKGLTKETDNRILAQAIKQTGKPGKRGDENPSKRPEVKKKISETCIRKSKEGTWHTSLAKNKHIKYEGCDFDSTWEVEYAKYLDSISYEWIRTKERFYYTYQGKNHYYNPDFYIKTTNEYIEIKGYATGKDYAKWKQFPKDKTLKILRYQELINLGLDIKK